MTKEDAEDFSSLIDEDVEVSWEELKRMREESKKGVSQHTKSDS